MHACPQCGIHAQMHMCADRWWHLYIDALACITVSMDTSVHLCIHADCVGIYALMHLHASPYQWPNLCIYVYMLTMLASIHRCTCMHYCINGYIGASMHTCRLCWLLCIDALACIAVPMGFMGGGGHKRNTSGFTGGIRLTGAISTTWSYDPPALIYGCSPTYFIQR